jgi:hypothetical protein
VRPLSQARELGSPLAVEGHVEAMSRASCHSSRVAPCNTERVPLLGVRLTVYREDDDSAVS